MGEMLAHIGYGDRKALLDKALDICTVTEKKLVITGHEDGCTGEAFTDYLIDTIRALRS
jgi:isocitrate dehydrogenase (NAD+)